MTHDLVVIGTSAGGVSALKTLAASLPADLNASLFVVIHVAADGPALMADILNSAGPLKAAYPQDRQTFERGHIYLAPPDHHLLLEGGRMRVVRGPKENWHRPAIDPLFRSAAVEYGPRVVGVVLTGYRSDGTSGLFAVKERGGTAVVQDPKDAEIAEMPINALKRVEVDHCLPLAEIAPLLARLTATSVAATHPKLMPDSEPLELEAKIPLGEFSVEIADRVGTRSIFSCPECHGGLWEVKDDKLLRYRCHVGHAFDAEILSSGQDDAVEKALWIALRTLKEHGKLSLQMAERAKAARDDSAQALFEARARQSAQKEAIVQSLLTTEHP